MNEKPAMLAVSSRTWVCYSYQARVHFTPLSYDPLEYVLPLCCLPA